MLRNTVNIKAAIDFFIMDSRFIAFLLHVLFIKLPNIFRFLNERYSISIVLIEL